MGKKKLIDKFKERGFIGSLRIMLYKPVRSVYRLYLGKFAKVNKKQILFFSCPNYSDNAFSMYQYFQENEKFKDWNYVWLFENKSAIPKNLNHRNTEYIKCQMDWCKGFNMKAMRRIAESKYIFYTHYSPARYTKRSEEQKVINLWHGCGYKAAELANPGPVQFDIALVPGPVFIDPKSEFWGCDKRKVIPIGYPRYDTLFKQSEKGKKFIDNIKKDNQKLVLWMPTFRNTATDWFPENRIERAFDLPILSSVEEADQLNEYCRQNSIMLCVKRHRNQKQYQCEKKNYSNIAFINDTNLIRSSTELYSLFQYTDGLVTDYSSTSIDYMLLDKPIAFALDDYEQYRNTRGFVFENPLDYMPGQHLYNYYDLISFLEDVASGKDSHAKDREKLMPEVHNPCDGYCERVWEYVKDM